METGSVKLNLGAGGTELDGYIAIDRKLGTEVYPLNYADGTVDEIRASHVLEHFSHREVGDVLRDWIRALKPGGVLRIAVPDFEFVAKQYLAGIPINVQGYIMGGHVDGDDKHGVIFDRETLEEALADLGMAGICSWKSELEDCASLPISLNVMAYKPVSSEKPDLSGTRAVMASARFGPALHHRCAYEALERMGIPYHVSVGCFWAQNLCEMIEKQLEDPSVKYILTADFDTIFRVEDVLELHRLAAAFEDAKAIVPVQAKRCSHEALFTIGDGKGGLKKHAYKSDFSRNLTQISTGHFGLTLINADCLRALPRPWMNAQPNADGRWNGGHVDADIMFWRKWHEAGHKVFLANNVRVGHMQELVTWPGEDFRPIHQTLNDYQVNGIPAEAKRL